MASRLIFRHEKIRAAFAARSQRTVNNRQGPDFSLICDKIAMTSAAAERAKR